MLSNDWEITDGAGLKEWLEKLKSGEGEYKAWDWARGVNIAWAGLRAGYITREEVDAYISSLVPLAQAKYADWNAYFDDFLAGCKDFDPEDTYGTAEDIEKGVKELLENKASIYKGRTLQVVRPQLSKSTEAVPHTWGTASASYVNASLLISSGAWGHLLASSRSRVRLPS